METYCVRCKTKIAFKEEPPLFRMKNDRYIVKSVCIVCEKKIFVSEKGNLLPGKLFKVFDEKIPGLGYIP